MEGKPVPISRGLDGRITKVNKSLETAGDWYAEVSAMSNALREARTTELAKSSDQIDFGYLSELEQRDEALDAISTKLDGVMEHGLDMAEELRAKRAELDALLHRHIIADE